MPEWAQWELALLTPTIVVVGALWKEHAARVRLQVEVANMKTDIDELKTKSGERNEKIFEKLEEQGNMLHRICGKLEIPI